MLYKKMALVKQSFTINLFLKRMSFIGADIYHTQNTETKPIIQFGRLQFQRIARTKNCLQSLELSTNNCVSSIILKKEILFKENIS